MSEQDNISFVQNSYAAFGREDMASVMDSLTDDVEWVIPGAPENPLVGTARGKQAVGEWFQRLGTELDFARFEPREFYASGDKVLVVVSTEATVRSTGKKVTQDEIHGWTIRGGKLARFQGWSDTAAESEAFRA